MGLFDKLFGPPTKDKFAQMILAGIRQAGETREIQYDPAAFRLHVGAGKNSNQLFLENGYQEYCAAPKGVRDQVVGLLVRSWFTVAMKLPEDFEDAKPDLLPVVRSRSYFELTKLRLQLEGETPSDWAYQCVGDHLAAALAYDLPQAMQLMNAQQLDDWGVTFYEAMEIARRNLAGLPHAFIGPQDGEGVYMSATNDNYDASRLFLLDTIREMKVKGDPIAMTPNRDTLLVAGADDLDALKGMLALANDALRKPRPISGVALRLDGDEWESWLPDCSHPLHEEFRNLAIQWIGHDYQEQKELLEKLHEKTGEDIFVASYSGLTRKDTGTMMTYCVWVKDVLSLLPQTDLVAFVADGKNSAMVPWDRVVEVVGDLMKPEGMYPERHRVADFPSEGQLALMGRSGRFFTE